MEPEFQVGDRVDHKTVFCKRNGRVESVIERTVYNVYRVRFAHCSGDFFESELVKALDPVEEPHDQPL